MFQDGSGRSIKSLFLGAHSPEHPNRQANSASGDPKKTNPPEHPGKNPSRYLTPGNSIKGGIHRPQEANFPPAPSFGAARSQQAGSEQLEQASKVGKRTTTNATESSRFTPNGFTYYFTFFSKFFSSFPHGTCSLSVSGEYLALEGIYLPLCATVPSNTTLSTVTVTGVSQDHDGAITLYSRLSQQPVRP